MHISEKYRRGKQHISHRKSEREKASERERERGRRERERREGERDALGLTIFNTHFLLFCVNTEAIAGDSEKEDKRQHKYDASQK